MRKSLLLVLVFVLGLCIPLWSQGLGLGPADRVELTPWWDRPIVRDLGLSDDQLKQVREIVRESRDRLIQLRAAVRSAEGALADELSAEIVDTGKAENAIERVVSARADLMRATALMSLKLRQVLTAQQWQELRKRWLQQGAGGAARRQRNRARN